MCVRKVRKASTLVKNRGIFWCFPVSRSFTYMYNMFGWALVILLFLLTRIFVRKGNLSHVKHFIWKENKSNNPVNKKAYCFFTLS